MIAALIRLLLLAACATPTLAASTQDPAAIRDVAARFLLTQAAGQPGKVSVDVKPPRSAPAACAALDAFQPAGSRPIGRTTVGVRCQAPTAWTVYLPAQVSVIGQYVATVRPLPARHVIVPGDLALREGDLGALPLDVARDPGALLGYSTVSGIAAGAALRAGVLRPPLVVQQGQPTRLVILGPGFALRSEGQALANASRGDHVRVKTASGQVVSGIARDGQQVEVAF